MSTTPALRIGTRGSDLALWQANWVKDALARRLGRRCELKVMKTSGDVHTGVSLARLGAQLGEVGVFVKELERALLAGEVDLAVHSLKDLPTDVPPGLVVACRPVRVDVRDLLLVNAARHDPRDPLLPLRHGARVGTSSVRRRVLLLERRPDLELVTIRGNVPTRVNLARTGEVDAVVLAAAGIDRLGLDLAGLVRVDLPAARFVPAPGQGALALETRADDPALLADLRSLEDPAAAAATDAERALLHGIGAGCSVPLGAHAVVEGGEVVLRAALGPAAVATGTRPWLRRVVVRAADASAAARLGLAALGPPPAAGAGVRPRLEGRRVLVLREPERARELLAALAAEGAAAAARAATEDRPVAPDAGPALRAALDRLPAGTGWVAFTSAAAVAHAVAALGGAALGGAALGGAALEAPGAGAEAAAGAEPAGADGLAGLRRRRLAAVGAATAQALGERDLPVDLVADEGSGAGLAATLLARLGAARPEVLLPCARGGRPELGEALAAAGCPVTSVELYASAPLAPPTDAELQADAVVVAAPSAARAALAGRPVAARLVAIGETTARALRDLGHPVAAVAAAPTPAALVEAVVAALGG